MAKVGGIGTVAKSIIGVSIAVLIWAILGYGVGIFQLYNTTAAAGTPSAVITVSQLGVAVAASIGVMVKFFE